MVLDESQSHALILDIVFPTHYAYSHRHISVNIQQPQLFPFTSKANLAQMQTPHVII